MERSDFGDEWYKRLMEKTAIELRTWYAFSRNEV